MYYQLPERTEAATDTQLHHAHRISGYRPQFRLWEVMLITRKVAVAFIGSYFQTVEIQVSSASINDYRTAIMTATWEFMGFNCCDECKSECNF